jgi:hypothetical protein
VTTVVTLAQAKAYVAKDDTGTTNDSYIQDCIDEATDMVTTFIGSATVPDLAKDRAVLETVMSLYHRRQAPNGLAQFAGIDGTTVIRVPRDPMAGAYPILARYMVIGL